MIDERKGRNIAIRLGIKVVGTLGILVLGKSNGFINEVKPLIEQMKRFEFRISDALYDKVLQLTNEKY